MKQNELWDDGTPMPTFESILAEILRSRRPLRTQDRYVETPIKARSPYRRVVRLLDNYIKSRTLNGRVRAADVIWFLHDFNWPKSSIPGWLERVYCGMYGRRLVEAEPDGYPGWLWVSIPKHPRRRTQ